MAPAAGQKSTAEITALESRIRESPQLVVEYLRLARLLEESGDSKAAAAALQRAHFFLPNGPVIMSELRRLSKWVDASQAPITIVRPVDAPAASPPEEPDAKTVRVEETPEPATTEDDLDQLIEGLEKARMSPRGDTVRSEEIESADDDGLVSTETLAQIYASQKQFQEAAMVYDRLAAKASDPDRAATLRDKAAELRKKLGSG